MESANTAQGVGVPVVAPPTSAAERIFALDVIRGFAVLGILLMNILGFGLTSPAYSSATAEVGGADGLNHWAWLAEMFYFEGTMRGLFTLLFGAGVVLYTSRLEKAGLGLQVADLYFRRNLWLWAFGLFNAWILLWQGDILYFYGLAALFLFVFRNLPVKKLLLWAALLLCVQPIVGIRDYQALADAHAQAPALIAKEDAGQALTKAEEETLEDYRDSFREVKPDLAKVEKANREMRGGYQTAAYRVRSHVWNFETEYFAMMGLWECLGMMLVGMALFKSGALTLGWSTRSYLALLLAGYGFGLTVNALEIRHVLSHPGDPVAAMLPWTLTYDLGRIPTTLGHVALAMLVIRSGWVRGLLAPFAAAGRMALSNYLAQSVICLFLFTGLGLGWFGQLQRYELYYVVFAIWAVELAWSPLWLAHFQYGPMEWLWRSLTRWQVQPMRKVAGMHAHSES
ncbi:MAG: DUF418 domain-containing protein [Gammaproteobacteria bacterium]|nr:DUF418 domain-containing protein [Gammaproteobacteria bacterium]